MRNLLIILLLPLLLVIASACSDDRSESKTNQVEKNRERRSENQRAREDWTVEKMIEKMKRDLKERLILSDDVAEQIGKFYTEAHLEGGGSLQDTVTRVDIKEMRNTLMSETMDQVLPLLNEDQSQFYKRYLKK